jgi:hypothetical protein
MLKSLTFLFALITLTTNVNAESEFPSRDVIDSTFTEMYRFGAVGDYESWVEFLAEDATFINSALREPIVGRAAILEAARTWPEIENVIEWKVIEGGRMAIAWRERQKLENGKMSGWYRGFSSFVFNGNGEVQEYEGMFNLLSIKAALEQVE